MSQEIIYEEETDEQDDDADDITVASSVYSSSKASSYKRQLRMDEEDEEEEEEEEEEEGESEKTDPEHVPQTATPVSEQQLNVRDEEDKRLTEAVEATKKASKLARREQRRLEKEARELKRQRARERTNSNSIPLPTTGHTSPLPAVIANLTPMSDRQPHKTPAGPKLTLVAILFSPLHDPDIERMKATLQQSPSHGTGHHPSTSNNLSNSHSAAMAAAAMAASGVPM